MAKLFEDLSFLSEEVVTLRPWRMADAPALLGICLDERVLRFTQVPGGYTLEMARSRVRKARAERRAGACLMLAVCEAPGRALGALDLRPSDEGRVVELAYMLGPEGRGRGLMTRAVALATRYALSELGAVRVQITCHPDNGASAAVAQRAGFRCEGRLERYLRGEDRLMWALCA